MNQLSIGKFISQKRKEKNLTQAELAEKLGVSNKTISKWETGKCMPDYSIIQALCQEIGITVSELMDGEDKEPDSIRTYDEGQMLDIIRRTQTLENQRTMLFGAVLISMGIAMGALSFNVRGSNVRDFMSGLLLGLALVEMMAGIYITGMGMTKQK